MWFSHCPPARSFARFVRRFRRQADQRIGRNRPLPFSQEHQRIDVELADGRGVLLDHGGNRQDDIDRGVQIGRRRPPETVKKRGALQLTQRMQHPRFGGGQ